MEEMREREDELDENPWKRLTDTEKPGNGTTAMAAFLFLLASVAVPLGLYRPILSVGFWIVLLFFGVFFTHKQKNNLLLLAAATVGASVLPGMLVPSDMTFYLSLGCLVAAVCVGVMAGSFFQTVTRMVPVLILETVIAVGAAYLVTGSWLLASLGAALLPAVLLLSVATNMGSGCTSAICVTVGGLLLTLAGYGVAWLILNRGGVSVEDVTELLSGWKEMFIQKQIASREALLSAFEELKNSGEELPAETVKQLDAVREQLLGSLSDEAIRASVYRTFSVLPAVMVVSCSICAYLAQRMLCGAYLTHGLGQVVTLESEYLTMSLPSAAVFLLGVTLVAFTKESTLVNVVASNLSLMLMPGFFLLAVRQYKKQRLPLMPGGRRTAVLIFALLVCCASESAFYLVAALGACDRILSPMRRKLEKKLSDGNDRDPD